MTLKTETNTPEMGDRVAAAFAASQIAHGSISADFEHGQWWITILETGAQWSVCDAEGGDAVDGFCFEQVSEGEEEEEDYPEDDYDGQPDELTEWLDFDPDC